MSVLAFLERLLSSAAWFPLQVCCLVLKVYVNSVYVSICVPVDSLHGYCRIHHFDLKLSLILLFISCPPLEMFSDFPLINKYCCRPSSPPVSSGPGHIGEFLGDEHCSCPHTHLVFQRHTACIFYGALCLSTESLWLCISSWSCVMWLCCVVLGHAFKPQDFWVLIANWKGKTSWIFSRKTVEDMTFLLLLGVEQISL